MTSTTTKRPTTLCDPREEWMAEVETELAKPHVRARQQAVKNVARRRPELREALVAAANAR